MQRQRFTSIALGLVLVGALGSVALKTRAPTTTPTAEQPIAAPSPPAQPPAAALAPETPSAAAEEAPEPRVTAGFDTMPDGAPVPQLPDSAPKSVRFGVILFTYEGAQFAPKDARSKAEAFERAQRAVAAAVEDFSEAVKDGDSGSTADAGTIPRGVLEPYAEYALFTLAKGAVHPQPLDTPRGYWVVRRVQ